MGSKPSLSNKKHLLCFIARLSTWNNLCFKTNQITCFLKYFHVIYYKSNNYTTNWWYKSNIHTTIWFLPLYIWQRQFTIRAIFIPPFDAMSRSTHYVTQPNNSLYELNKINKKRKDNKSCQHQFARTVRHDNYWLIAMKWEVSSNVSKLKMRYMYDHMTLH